MVSDVPFQKTTILKSFKDQGKCKVKAGTKERTPLSQGRDKRDRLVSPIMLYYLAGSISLFVLNLMLVNKNPEQSMGGTTCQKYCTLVLKMIISVSTQAAEQDGSLTYLNKNQTWRIKSFWQSVNLLSLSYVHLEKLKSDIIVCSTTRSDRQTGL